MCLFTHFAAGALVGGISGNIAVAILGGFASHALLDALPHYDFPDWRVEIVGAAGALLLLLALPFASAAAVIGGLAGVLPDLENLLWKLGKLQRRFFIFPSHTGLIRHGRDCSPRNLLGQAVLTAACFVALGLFAPEAARAAADFSADGINVGAARMQLQSAGSGATVVWISFPAQDASTAGSTASAKQTARRQVGVRLLAADGQYVEMPPQHRFCVAVPGDGKPSWRVTDLVWHREPSEPIVPESLISISAPALLRGVPLATVVVQALAPSGGVVAGMRLQIAHPPTGRYAEYLAAAERSSHVRWEPPSIPADLVNKDLYAKLRYGLRSWRAQNKSLLLSFADHPLNVTNHWVRLEVGATGVYSVTGMDLELAGVPLDGVDSQKLRLFKGGSLPLAVSDVDLDSLPAERTGFTEVAIDVQDTDGDWDGGDRILFYGYAGDAWLDRLDASAAPLDHFEHPYQGEGIYWLTWESPVTASPFPNDPLRIGFADRPAHAGIAAVQTYAARRHFEESGAQAIGVVQDNWAWDTLVFGRRDLSLTIPDALAGQPARYVIDIRAVARRTTRITYENHASAWLNDDSAHAAAIDWTIRNQNDSLRVRLIGSSNDLEPGLNTLRLQNDNEPDPDTGAAALALALDSFDVMYRAALFKSGGQQLHCAHWASEVTAPDTPINYQIHASQSGISVWDVSDPLAAVALGGTTGDDGSPFVTFGLDRQPTASRHFVAFSAADVLRPGLNRYFPSGLTRWIGPTDYIVIYDQRFVTAAAELASLRSEHLPGAEAFDPVAIAVPQQDIYDYFSGGLKDPLALRNFLSWLFDLTDADAQGQHALRFVCLMGDASRDYRNYLNHDPASQLYDFVPTIVRTAFPTDPHQGSWYNEPYATDDALVSFDLPDPGLVLDIPDLAVGRLTVRSRSEAQQVVARISDYATDPEAGSWRNRVVFAADDLDGPSHSGQDDHMVWADSLANGYVPETLDVQKVYLLDYDKAPGSEYKPGARQDAKRYLSEGTTVFHYIGHGGDNVLADEQVLLIDDIYTLSNGARRGVFLAFSCDVGIYDSPLSQSMAEVFVAQPDGGAIAAVCASQVSWIDTNEVLSGRFYRNLYPGRQATANSTLGEALHMAKFDVGESHGIYPRYLHNSQRYALFGDPGLHLPNPVSGLTFAAASADTLHGGAREAVLIDLSQQEWSIGPGATYDLLVEESRNDKSITVNYQLYQVTVDFWLPGAAVFRGNGDSFDDLLRVPFKVPVQLNYGPRGRIRLIVDSPQGSWAGVMHPPVVQAGTGDVDDLDGPRIRLAFADDRYRVRAGTQLLATIEDTSGVNILGTKPGNSINLEFDDTGILSDVSDAFVFDAGSFSRGQLTVSLPDDLDLGPHKASLYAADVLGNVGSDTVSFLLVAEGVTSIEDVTVFPNPTTGPCRLIFEISDPMHVEWSVYTLAGRRILQMHFDYPTPGPKIIEWDGRDAWGDDIANGVYLYVMRGSWEGNEEHDLKITGQLIMMK